MSKISIKNDKSMELWSYFNWILSDGHKIAVSNGLCFSPTISSSNYLLQLKMLQVRENFEHLEISIKLHEENGKFQIKRKCSVRFMVEENCVWSASMSGVFEFDKFHIIGKISKSEFSGYEDLTSFKSVRLEGEFKVYDEADCEWKEYLFELDKIKDRLLELSKLYSALLENKILSDFCIQVDDVKFQVHKTILAARSSVFASMFMQNMKENQENIMKITDFKPETVEKFINYIYKGYTEELEKDALELFKIADKYDLTGLKTKCEKVLCNTISVDNSVDILNVAELYNAKKLKLTARSFIKEHIKEIIDSPGFFKLIGWNLTAMNLLTCFKN